MFTLSINSLFRFIFILTLTTALFLPNISFAAHSSGDADASLNYPNGFVQITTANDSRGSLDFIVDENNKYVVVGYKFDLAAAKSDSYIARYNMDGSPDTTFGNNGIVDINIPEAESGTPGDLRSNVFHKIKEQKLIANNASDNVYIVTGSYFDNGPYKTFVTAIDQNGNLVSTFGPNGNGLFIFDPSGTENTQPAGLDLFSSTSQNYADYITVTGKRKSTTAPAAGLPVTKLYECFLFVLDSNGLMYTSFNGGAGFYYHPLTGNDKSCFGRSVATKPNGKIMVGAKDTTYTAGGPSSGTSELLLLKFDILNALDSGYSGTGTLQRAVAVADDITVHFYFSDIITTYTNRSTDEFEIFRTAWNGNLKTGYGNTPPGVTTGNFGYTDVSLTQSYLFADGTMAIGGYPYDLTNPDEHVIGLAAIKRDGQPKTIFGPNGDGIVITPTAETEHVKKIDVDSYNRITLLTTNMQGTVGYLRRYYTLVNTDIDGDGIAADCNENDPNISAETTWCDDKGDEDGYGDPNNCISQCAKPFGYVGNSLDCEPQINGQPMAWCFDADGDGYGDPNTQQIACWGYTNYGSNCEDCDDTDDRVHPGAQGNNDCP